MKFDPKKPHGTITNHAWARFEQDGVLYDQLGRELDEYGHAEEIKEELPPPVLLEQIPEKDFALDQAKDFLKNILHDGPLARSVIFKECASNNQNWEKVKTAFSDLGCEAFHRRNVIQWKLKAE